MLTEKHSDMLRSTLSHNAELEHRIKMEILCDKRDIETFKLVSMLGLVPYKDGDQWCVLWGTNIQEGICGFGDSPLAATINFNDNCMLVEENFKQNQGE